MPDVKYIITADESGALASVKRVNAEVAKASGLGTSAVGALTGSYRGLASAVGSVAQLFGGLAIAGIIREQAVAATNFQREWTKVQVILRDDQGGAATLEKFKQQVLDLPPVFGTAADNARAFYQIISSGFADPREALILLKAAAVAAAGGFTDTEVAVRTGAAVLQAYGLQVEQSQHVFDVMAKTVDLGVVSFEELASQLGNVIPIAAANNVTFEEVASSIAAMTLQGVPAALAVTGLRSTIASLLEPSKEAQEVAERLGLHWNAAGLKALGLEGVLGELRKNGITVTSEDIAKLTGRIEATNFVMAATSEKGAKNLKDALEANRKASDGLGASQASLAASMESPTTRWKEFTSALGNASAEMGTKLAPAASSTLKWLTELVQGAREGALELNALSIAFIAVAFGIGAANLSTFLTSLGLVARAATLVTGLMAAFTGWGGLLANIAGGFTTVASTIWATVTAAGALQTALIAVTGFGLIAAAAAYLTSELTDLWAAWKQGEVDTANADASMMRMAGALANAGRSVPGFAAQVQKATREFNASGNTEEFRKELARLQEEFRKTNPELFFKEATMKKQAALMKSLGTETVQSYKDSYAEALKNFNDLKALRGVPQGAEERKELEANIAKAETFVKMRKDKLDAALGKKGAAGGGGSDDMKKILEQRRQIDDGIASMNEKSLTGIQAQFAEIDTSLRKLLQNPAITPAQSQDALRAAQNARSAIIDKEREEMTKKGVGDLQKGIEAEIEAGLKVSNAAALDIIKGRIDAQKEFEQIGVDTRLALARTEGERMSIEIDRQVQAFEMKYKALDNVADLSSAYRIRLEEQAAAVIAERARQRMEGLSEDIRLLQAETSGGGQSLLGFNNRAIRDNAEVQRLKVEQEIRYNKAVREGALDAELQLIQQKEGLELLRLQQTQYDRMFDTVKGQAEGVFDAIFLRGKKGFDGLLDYIKGVFVVKVKDIFGNLVARLFTGERPGGEAGAAGGIMDGILGSLGIRRAPSAQAAASKEITDAIKGSVGQAAKVAQENSCMCFQKGIQELKPAPDNGGLLGKAAGIIGGVGGGVGALIGIASKTASAAAGPVGQATVTLTTEAGEIIGGIGAAGQVVGGSAAAGIAGGATTAGELALPSSIFTAGTAAGGGGVAGGSAGAGTAATGGSGTSGLLSGGLGSIGKFLSGGMSGTLGTVGALTAGIGGGFLGGFGTGKALSIGGTRSAIAGGIGAGVGALATAFLGPLAGALIGAGAGAAAAGLFRIFGGKDRAAVLGKEIQRDFGIVVNDGRMLKQIKQMGEAAFGKDADKKRFETLRLDSVQSMLLSYASATGQDPSKLPIYQSMFGTGKLADNARINIGGGGSNILGGAMTGGVSVGQGLAGVVPGAVDRFTGRVGTGSPTAAFGAVGDGRIHAGAGGSGATHVEQTVAPIIYINGAKDPHATGRAVATAVQGVANNARRELVKDVTVALGRDEGRKGFREALFG